MTSDATHGAGPATVELTRDAFGTITSVDGSMVELLGWTPEQLVGQPSTDFVHPDDRPSAIAAWMDMLKVPGSTRLWLGRYRAADGSWKWVQSINENRLDDDGVVCSSMRTVTVEQLGLEEELRARKQLLNQLSDALPVGVVQIDARGTITFTNDRLHAILGTSPVATIDALLAGLVPEDRGLLDAAVAAVLREEVVDGLELRLDVPIRRVCQLSLRPLTDGNGTVRGAVGCISDVTDQVSFRRELEIRASIDPLTSCLNRSATLELLTVTTDHHDRSGAGTAVVYVDLERFKQVNDLYGHAAGDHILVTAADILRVVARPGDQVGRIGGDEFLVICPHVANSSRALEIGQRITGALDTDIDVGASVVALKASVGVAWTNAVIDADALVAHADSAMYTSKRNGSHLATLFDGESPANADTPSPRG
jgi:diguanylate cyclase (GGDEF)-like protein/PAS domain S-box-containing protein